MYVHQQYGVEIVAWVSSIGDQEIDKEINLDTISRDDVDKSLVRCPDEEATVKMIEVASLQPSPSQIKCSLYM